MPPVHKFSAMGSLTTNKIDYPSMLAGNPVFNPSSYDSIATVTAPAGAVTFTSIPSIYQHLQVRCLTRGVRSFAGEQLYVRLNGDGGSNYAYHALYGDGGGVTSSAQTPSNVFFVNEFPAANETANIYSASVIDILDANSTTKNTTMRSLGGYDNNGNTGLVNSKVWMGSAVWLNTAAVTSVTVLSNGSFTSPSTFALYGIKGA